MGELLIEATRRFLLSIQGKEIKLDVLRKELRLDPASKEWDGIRNVMFRLAEQKLVKPSGKRDGEYKVITQVKPVTVFGKEPGDPLKLFFPRDFETMDEMLFSQDIVLRTGDLILVSGVSNFGKTTLCMNFCGENLDGKPVLMGNEYTTVDGAPTPRFLKRIETMNWVDWFDEQGDRFMLLPVREDYAEHVVKDKLNIIDWINIESGEHYLIGTVLEGIKRNLGSGIGIVALQKGEGSLAGRGGQFTKDFADLELLIDRFGEKEVLLTIGKVKECNLPVMGRTFAYSIEDGMKIIGFREVIKCTYCYGKGWVRNVPCQYCDKAGYLNKEETRDNWRKETA